MKKWDIRMSARQHYGNHGKGRKFDEENAGVIFIPLSLRSDRV